MERIELVPNVIRELKSVCMPQYFSRNCPLDYSLYVVLVSCENSWTNGQEGPAGVVDYNNISMEKRIPLAR